MSFICLTTYSNDFPYFHKIAAPEEGLTVQKYGKTEFSILFSFFDVAFIIADSRGNHSALKKIGPRNSIWTLWQLVNFS